MDMAAWAPSPTAVEICRRPPMQSPAAYRPGTLVSIRSLTTMLPLSPGSGLFCQLHSSRTSQGYEQPLHRKLASVRKGDALHPLRSVHRKKRLPDDGDALRHLCSKLLAVGQKGNGACYRKKLAHLVDGIGFISKNRDVFPAIEKGITDGAVADASALQLL